MSENENRFYVDEAGDLALFNRRGRMIVGEQGCSQFFMVGVAKIPAPSLAEEYLRSLRSDLLTDPYFRGVPSLQPEARKTACLFHAKDDLPEVRREVFRLLPRLSAKVQVAIRRKHAVARSAQQMRRVAPTYRLQANDVYDDLVKRLFRNVLHKADRNHVIFARRGKTDRIKALGAAIDKAKRNFERKHRIPSNRPTDILAAHPHEHAGLQVIDYYLWALQRMYERGEDRFFNLLRPAYRLIMDLDDARNKPYGEWYSDNNPLTLDRLTK